jgi:hypothetical protein
MVHRMLIVGAASLTACLWQSQALAGLLSYEGFETGTGGYTAGAALPGQSYQGTGQAAGGAWTADDGADTTVTATGLKHVVASKGGRAVHSGNGGSGSRVNFDLSAGGSWRERQCRSRRIRSEG